MSVSDVTALTTLAVGTVTAAAIDLRTRRVPNALTISLAAVGIVTAAAGFGHVDTWAALTGCAVGLLLMLPGHVFGATGAGDVKLFAAAGALLGPAMAVRAFLFTAVAGGSIALLVAIGRRRLGVTLRRTVSLVSTPRGTAAEIERAVDNRFAYAPAIAVGTLVAALGW